MFLLGDFIRVLRASEIRVSTSETLDAAQALQAVGMGERQTLKIALGQVLAKTDDEKDIFDVCFDTYFGSRDLTAQADNADDSEQEDTQSDATRQAGEREADQETHRQQGAASQAQDEGEAAAANDAHSLADIILSGNETQFSQRLAQASAEVGMSEVRLFTQQGLFTRRIMEAMGLADLEAEMRAARQAGAGARQHALEEARARLVERVRDYVEGQISMRTAHAGKLVREEALSRIKLSNVDHSDLHIMRRLITKLAKRLASLHARRRKRAQRGQLDARRTLRRGLRYDGVMMDLVWRREQINRPKLIIMCDISGSVAAVSRFLLMFLYSLGDVMPRSRSFVFTGQCHEVSDILSDHDIEEAMPRILHTYGQASSDYGTALSQLYTMVGDTIDHKTTLLVLGDGRSNYGDPGHLYLKEMSNRCRRVIWLNPESKALWNTGDSEMTRLGAYCHQVQACQSMRDLERVIDTLLRHSI